jgi:hypothetical protein
MDPLDTLQTIAEIAIAIAGFSGIAAVLGRGNDSQWSPEDAFRLRQLLQTSFQTVIFCFLPALMVAASLGADAVWAASSALWLLNAFILSISAIRGHRRIATSSGFEYERMYLPLVIPIVVAQPLLLLANVVSIREAWPYLAVAVTSLVIPFLLFLRLLSEVLRPGDDA